MVEINVGRVVGNDGRTPKIEIRNDYWFIDDNNTGIRAKGEPGKDGDTFDIVDDYWWINGKNTYVKARGYDGQDGYSPKIEIRDDYWFIDNINTGVRALGKDGYEGDRVSIRDGYWWINNENTGIKAEGKDGIDGTSFVIKGIYRTIDQLRREHPKGEAGEAWAIGTPEDASIWIWDIKADDWAELGPIHGPPGKDGRTPKIEIRNNYWWIDDENTGVKALGDAGKDGHSPIIEIRNDYWFIDNEPTGVRAKGQDGQKGDKIEIIDDYWWINDEKTNVKARGEDGNPGHSPVIEIRNNYWFIDNVNTNVRAIGEPGKDGHSPKIEIRDGFWWIDDVNTGIDARGIKGDDGHSPVIEIRNNYWYIDNHNTGIKAVGEDGHTPVIGENENWFINNKDSGKPSRGPAGRDGASNIEYVKLKSDFDEIKWDDLKKDTLYVIGSGKKKPQPPPMPPTPNTHTRRDSTSPAWESFFDKINSQDLSYWILYDFPTHLYSEKVLKRMDIFLNGVQKGTSQTSTASIIPHIVLRGSDHNGNPKHYIVLCKTTPEFQPLFQEYSATWNSIFFNMIESQANTWGRYSNTTETSTQPIRYHEHKNYEFFTSQGIHIDPYRTHVSGAVEDLTIFASVRIDEKKGENNDFCLAGTDGIEVKNEGVNGKNMWFNQGGKSNWLTDIKTDYPTEPYYALHKLEYKLTQENPTKKSAGDMPTLIYNENLTDLSSPDRKVDTKKLPGYPNKPEELGSILAQNPYWFTNTDKDRLIHPAVVVAFPKTVVNNEELDKELKFEYPKPQPAPDPVPDMNQKFYYHTEDQFID